MNLKTFLDLFEDVSTQLIIADSKGNLIKKRTIYNLVRDSHYSLACDVLSVSVEDNKTLLIIINI